MTTSAAAQRTWQPVAGAIGYQVDAAPGPAGPWTPLVLAPIANTNLFTVSPYYANAS